MKHVETVWRELLSRRLLPLAILLVAALAAIPFLLAKNPEPAGPVTAPVPGAGASTTTSPDASAVTLVTDGERTKRRRVLGARKNPFEPAAAPKGADKTTALGADPAQPQTSQTGGTGTTTPSNGGSTAPASAPPAAAPPASAPAAPKPHYELYSLTVRFGSTDGELQKSNLPRLKALPSADDPVLVYLGLAKDNKTAIFMVDSNVTPQGDGNCDPSPANCETIRLKVGDTEFFDVKDESGQVSSQYQLDLLNIKKSTTASASKAQAARAKVSKAGRKVLRVRKAQQGPLRWSYDARSGTVRRLDSKAYKAAVARTARIALAFSGGF
jgi:uncharacterized membrane protein